MTIGESLCLFLHHGSEFLAPIAHVDAPEAGQAVEITAAVRVYEPHALAADHDGGRPLGFVFRERRERVEAVPTIEIGKVLGRSSEHGMNSLGSNRALR